MAPFIWTALLFGIAYCAVLPPATTFNEASSTVVHPRDILKSREIIESLIVNPINKNIKLPKATGAWLTISCDKVSTTMQNHPNQTERYLDAGVPEAWDELMSAWTSYLENPTEGTSSDLRFPYWLADVYNLGEGAACDFMASACSDARCGANNLAPATRLIQDNFNFLWQMFHGITTAYSGARDVLNSQMSEFTKEFAPVINNKVMMQQLLEIFLFAGLVFIPTGFGSLVSREMATLSKVAEEAGRKAGIEAGKKAANDVVKTLPKNLPDAAIKHAKDEASNKASMKAAKDATDAMLAKQTLTPYAITANVLVGSAVYIHNSVGNYLKDAESLAEEKMAFNDYVSNYMLAITQQTNQSHSPLVELRDQESRDRMRSLVTDGSLNVMIIRNKKTAPDMSGVLQKEAEKVLWGMLIPTAWRSVQVPKHPFILRVDKKDYKCNDPVKNAKIDLELYMTDETREKTIWCDPEGNSFFLLQTKTFPSCSLPFGQKCKSQIGYKHFAPLPGGTTETLKRITGLEIKDLVYASYGAYLHNGNRNGYVMDAGKNEIVGDDFKVREGEAKLAMSGGLRIPGFFNISVCTDAQAAAQNSQGGRFDAFGAPCDTSKQKKSDIQAVKDVMSSVLGKFTIGSSDWLKST